ncbi:uncharacterized protein CG7065-like isoform X2 [Anopheles aquasalis]|nr:uncharacterized protein CG7065-like isoform X2 [Anopheles aquasalis]
MLQIHIAGRRHQARLSVSSLDAEQYRASLVMKPKQNQASSAGDGMGASGASDSQGMDVKPEAQLQSVLDGYRAGPLVGLEYIVELKHQGPGEAVSYNCLLCDTRGNNESGITTHLIMPEHRLKFLERHYATVMKVIAPYRSAPGADAKDSVFCRVVQTICEAIEDHHGRMVPSVYDADDFGRNRAKYIQGVKFGKHCDEQTGPKFVELIDKKVLQDLKATTAGGAGGGGGGGGQRKYRNRNERRGSLDSISSLSSANSVMSISSSGDDDDESRLRKKSPLNRGTSQRVQSKLPPSIPTPKELSQQAAHIAHERYKWEKFRCTVELMKAPLLQLLKEYEKNPEKHPLYSEEWKKFWNRRYKELQAEKKDPSKHNFKPEWIEYWTKRMKELHDEEVERKKLEIRTKMNLPAEEEERTDELREQYTLRVPPNRPKERKGTLGGQLGSDSEGEYKGGQPLVNSRSRKRPSPPMKIERSAHPWSSESSKRPALSHSHRSRSPYSEDIAAHRLSRLAPPGAKRPPPVQTPPERVDYDEWAKNYYGPNKKVFVRTDFEDSSAPPTFIAVCRLLTAFEEYLGSLGPKVIDLLAKGLALEKVKANSADDLLLNEDNSMFLETVKEKLKGHLMAGTIDPPKIASIKRAVQNIASLLHEASKREPAPKPAEEEVSRDSLAISEISGVATPAAPSTSAGGPDKVTIAAQLAKALVAQGKTDFSTEELEQLINVYQAMVEMSRERKMIITTKVYLAACSSSAGLSNARTAAAVSKEVAASTTGSGTGPLSSMMFDRNRSDPPMTTYANRRLQEMDRKMTPEPNSLFRSSGMLENLSDSDLQTLLQTFKDLATDEQMHLITYLRKLERTEPERVEKLRRYVDFETINGPRGRGGGGGGAGAGRRGGQFDPDLSDDDDDDDRDSLRDRDDDAVGYDPFRANNDRGRSPAVNARNAARKDRSPKGILQQGQSSGKQQQLRNNDPAVGVDQSKKKILVDSDDEDDYSYDDILRAASKNVTSQPPAKDVDGESNSNHSQRANAAGAGAGAGGGGSVSNSSNTVPIPSLADTSNLVANLMESLQKSFSDAKNNAGTQDYSNPIMTIGSLGGGNGLDGAGHGGEGGGGGGAVGTIPAMNAFGSNMNGAGAGPRGPFFQRQQQQMHPQGPVRPMMQQQQPMGGAFGQQAQMQQAFGGQQQFMYPGQQFGANMNGQQQQQQQQQAAQYGYGNYGGYY